MTCCVCIPCAAYSNIKTFELWNAVMEDKNLHQTHCIRGRMLSRTARRLAYINVYRFIKIICTLCNLRKKNTRKENEKKTCDAHIPE